MQCNIDARGQLARRIWGILCVLAAVGLSIAAYLLESWWLYIVAVACMFLGLFAIWEAQKKWCIVRAMGIKTPM